MNRTYVTVLGALRHAVAGPAIWVMIGGIAAMYIAVMMIGLTGGPSDDAMDMGEQPRVGQRTSNSAERSMRLALRVKRQNSLIQELRGRIGNLENTMAHLRSRERDLAKRLSSLEDGLGPNTAALPSADAGGERMARVEPAEKPEPPKKTKMRYAPPITVAYAPLPSTGFGDEPDPELPVGVGEALEGAPGEDLVYDKPTQTMFAVKLAIGPDAAALAPSWKLVKRNHGDLVASLTARVVERTTGSAKRHELIAGPIDNAATAARICAKLRASSLYCQETMFAAGRRLEQ